MPLAFNEDMVKLTQHNDFFQKEAFLDARVQIVMMHILPGEEIGAETHPADQNTFIVSGHGKAVVDGEETKLGANRLIVIPKGAEHNIINTGKEPLKLFSIYAPPAEPKGVAHKTKADAEAAEEGFVSRAAKKVKEAISG